MIRLYDIPGHCWPQISTLKERIDRSSLRVTDYLESRGFCFVSNAHQADLHIRKAELSRFTLSGLEQEKNILQRLSSVPTIFLIGEPRELAPLSYMVAEPRRTLAVAPAHEFDRLWFGREWADPQLEDWKKRQDRFCWIGRPIGKRIELAVKLLELGIPLDIYSHQAWPLSAWKGPAPDDVETARAYRYRICCENSDQNLYHSEKLFTGLKSGCVCFYFGDSNLDLSFASDAYLPFDLRMISNREDLAPAVLKGVEKFMFSKRWEIYSYRHFYDQVMDLARRALEGSAQILGQGVEA